MPARPIAALALAAALLLAGCSRDSGEEDVRATLETFTEATARKDYQRLCDDLFSEKRVEEVESSLPCEVALQRSSLADAERPQLEVRSVRVDGDTATAVVR